MNKPRRNHSAAFNARVVRQVIRGEETVAELAKHDQVQPTQIATWESPLLDLSPSSVYYMPEPFSDRDLG